MGNPSTPRLIEQLGASNQPAGEPEYSAVNGYRAYLTVESLGDASAQLPRACAEQQANPVRQVELDTPNLGRVRVRFELSSYKHYRNRFWQWCAVWVDKIGPDEKTP